MSRRADAKNVAPGAMDATPTNAAAAQSSQVPVAAIAARGAGGTVPQAHVPPTVQAKLLLLQGKLMRRDRTFLTWKWRDFYLEQHRLQYFSEKGVRKGEIVITATTPIVIRLLDEPKPFALLLFIKDEKLTLAAATAQDRQKWIDVFTEVFHANVEDFQTHKATGGGVGVGGANVGASAGGDKPEKKRTRPTFLPIPDMSEDEGGAGHNHLHLHHAGTSAKTPVAAAGGSCATTTRTSQLGLGRHSDGALTAPTAVAAHAHTNANANANTTTAPTTANAAAVAAAATGKETSIVPHPELQERRSFRNNDGALVGGVGDVSIPRSKFIALKEQYSSVTFPRSLANGDVLVGVGPLVRRMGWTDERILAVGLYVDADAATKEMLRFHGRDLKSLRGDQAFYDYLVHSSKFRRSFVVTSRKRVSKSVLIALLHDEIAPRISGSTEALHTFLSFIEKSLRKAESLMLRIHPDAGRLDFRLRGQQYPPIASSMLCQCLQSVFFDVNSIQQDAKRRLVERFPLLWGIDDSDEAHHGHHGNSDRDLRSDEPESKRSEGGVSESEDDYDDDEEYDDDSEVHGRSSLSADERPAMQRNMSMKEKLDELDEREHELMRRESRSLGANFGPMVDKDSNALFRGDLLVDGSALLGTWSQKITYMVDVEEETEAALALQERSRIVSVGLYAEPGGASESLLKYKGLSVGSILQDMDFFARFADGLFTKHLIFKVDEAISVAKLVDYFTARVRRRGSGASTPGAGESGRSNDTKVRALLDRLDEERVGLLRPQDELRVTILSDSRMTLTVNREICENDGNDSEFRPVDDVKIAAAPFSTIFQGIFYGYHTLAPASRARLMERLPNLLDLAKDDLAHTYHDEIQVLKENYKRQLPEFRLKAGYMLISFEKKKLVKNADGVKEETITASKWSKRWCRLDGTTFSYFSHKRSKKPRDIIDLTQCSVSEINSASTSLELAPFATEKGARPSIRIGIAKRHNGEIVALKTESIYEGVEWLESLVEASNVVRAFVPQASDDEPDLAGIETSGVRDGDESSGAAYEGDDTVGDVEADEDLVTEDMAGGQARKFSRSPSRVDRSTVVVDKHGSLISWVREDSRHAFILALLLVVAWLITSQERVVVRSISQTLSDANSSLVTRADGGR